MKAHSVFAIVAVLLLFASAHSALAYSIYPNPTSTPAQSFDFGAAWNQLSAPFKNFFSSLENVTPNDLPNQSSNTNPSAQPQSIIPENSGAQKIFTTIINFLSWITSWLIVLADRLGQWVVSAIH